MGRHASVAFEDGSVMELSESETDKAVWKRRRFAGGVGHDFRQVFIMADGREIEILNNRPGFTEDNDGLDTGDHLILTANTLDTAEKPPLDSHRTVEEALKLRIDGSYRVAAGNGDASDRVYIDVIDGKDQVLTADYKATVGRTPAFVLSTEQSMEAERFNLLSGGNGYLGDSGSIMTGGMSINSSVSNPASGSGAVVALPPIGVTAVPEPSTLALFGVAGVMALAIRVRRGRRMAA